jgi:hypothetical protein
MTYIEPMPRSNFQYPSMRASESSTSIASEKGDDLDPFRDSVQSSRRESYSDPYPPATRPPLALGRGNGQRTLSDLYDESPPITPLGSGLRPGRPWMAGSRPESEATLISSYPPTPSPLVRILVTRLQESFSNCFNSEVPMLLTKPISQTRLHSTLTMTLMPTH